MFVPLSGNHAKGPEDGPSLLLQGCHIRIRRFTALALKLLDAPEVASAEVADAAGAVHRYFTEALPKHVEDEERSVAPRIVALVSSAALVRMTEQHRGLEEVLEPLGDLWRALASRPSDLPGLTLQLAGPTRKMASLWEPHLTLEESEIFPQVAQLSSAHRAAIWREMRERRKERP